MQSDIDLAGDKNASVWQQSQREKYERRHHRLAALIQERGLSTHGFRKSLRAIVSAILLSNEQTFGPYESVDFDALCRSIFGEWFGDCRVTPAAYRIIRSGPGVWDTTIEVYVVENSIPISDAMLMSYGRIADGEGPRCNLHILDRYDHEIVIPNQYLTQFSLLNIWNKTPGGREMIRSEMKALRSRATAQHHGCRDTGANRCTWKWSVFCRRLAKHGVTNLFASFFGNPVGAFRRK